MILIQGPNGGVNWRYTSRFFKDNFALFIELFKTGKIPREAYETWRNFGPFNEPAFICSSCKRVLPIVLADVDHVCPKSGLKAVTTVNGDEITRVGTTYMFPPGGNINTIFVNWENGGVENGGALISRMFQVKGKQLQINLNSSPHNTRQSVNWCGPINLDDVIKNDLENLNLLCGYCNSSKGARC